MWNISRVEFAILANEREAQYSCETDGGKDEDSYRRLVATHVGGERAQLTVGRHCSEIPGTGFFIIQVWRVDLSKVSHHVDEGKRSSSLFHGARELPS